jgi:hypoxanthine phosphoribosyltransferase
MATEKQLIEKIIYTNEQIVEASKKMAAELNEEYKGKEVVIVSILSGALPFTMELIKHLEFDVYLDFLKSSSYEFDKKISEPKIEYAAKIPLTDRHVIIVDEIIDSGETIEKVTRVLEGYQPASIAIAALLVKPERIKPTVKEFYCYEHATDDFLIGFGLD